MAIFRPAPRLLLLLLTAHCANSERRETHLGPADGSSETAAIGVGPKSELSSRREAPFKKRLLPRLAARASGKAAIGASPRNGSGGRQKARPKKPDKGPVFLSLDDALVSWVQVNATARRDEHLPEDVECFCARPYLYIDFDDEEVSLADCLGRGDPANRCDNICERKGKTVAFEGKRQTLSFCGGDEGEPYEMEEEKTQCQCFDAKDTMSDSNLKNGAKHVHKGHKATGGVWMVKVKRDFDAYASSEDNLRACYAECPRVCHDKFWSVGGCAFPVYDSARQGPRHLTDMPVLLPALMVALLALSH